MSDRERLIEDRAGELRRAFDASFAERAALEVEERTAILRVRVEGRPYAIRLGEVGSIFADRKVVPYPSGNRAILGLCGVRGLPAPIYSLRVLVGRARESETPRWFVLARAVRVGFAFEAFEGQLLVERGAIASVTERAAHVRELVRDGETLRPIIDLASLIEALSREGSGR